MKTNKAATRPPKMGENNKNILLQRTPPYNNGFHSARQMARSNNWDAIIKLQIR